MTANSHSLSLSLDRLVEQAGSCASIALPFLLPALGASSAAVAAYHCYLLTQFRVSEESSGLIGYGLISLID
jgi:hypothetical protein